MRVLQTRFIILHLLVDSTDAIHPKIKFEIHILEDYIK